MKKILFLTFMTALLISGSHFSFGQDTIQTDKNDTLIVGVKKAPPFLMKDETGEFKGLNIFLWEEISSELKIPCKFKELTLNEILSELESGELDISINPLTITSERLKRIDFSLPFYVSNTAVAAKQETGLQTIIQFVISFFSMNFLKAIFLLLGIIFLFGFITWIFERKENPEEFENNIKGIGSGIWWSAVTMTTVGYGDKTPRSTIGRIIALIWMFTAVIVISGFTASIASSLTVDRLGFNIEDLNDLRKLEVGTVENSASAEFLETNFFESREYETISDGLQAMNEGDLKVFAYDEPILKYTIRRDSLVDLGILPVKFNKQYYSFGFSEKLDDNIKDKISTKLIEITESNSWKVVLSQYDLHE